MSYLYTQTHTRELKNTQKDAQNVSLPLALKNILVECGENHPLP